MKRLVAHKFRSATTSRPSLSNPVSSAVRVCSPTVMPAQRAPISARDPHSANATTRTCGNAPAPRPPPGRPNAAAFTAVSGTSTVNPSKATSRRPATCAQPSSRPANGPATRSYRSAITCHPSRERALEIAAGDGDIPTATRSRKLFAPPEAPDQLRPHLAVTGLEEHDHRQVVVHHQPGRQHPNPLLTHPGRGHHLIDQTRREDLRQHPHSDLTRQPVLAQPRDLLPNTRHPKTIAHGTAKLTPLGLAKSGQKRSRVTAKHNHLCRRLGKRWICPRWVRVQAVAPSTDTCGIEVETPFYENATGQVADERAAPAVALCARSLLCWDHPPPGDARLHLLAGGRGALDYVGTDGGAVRS